MTSREAVNDLRSIFPALILREQNLFGTEEGYKELLRIIPDSNVVASLQSRWEDDPYSSSEAKWMDLLRYASSNKVSWRGTFFFLVTELNVFKNIMNALEDIILLYTYPRLDAEVSKLRHHLLKAPFCVHPKTGRVCVPVDPAMVDVFDPATVPTVGQLLQELDEAANQDAGDNTRPGMEINLYDSNHHLYFCYVDWEKTSLKPYVDFLDKHIQSILDEARQAKLKSGQHSYLLKT